MRNYPRALKRKRMCHRNSQNGVSILVIIGMETTKTRLIGSSYKNFNSMN